MLVMFAVGTMNVFWMALIGLFTVVEKQSIGQPSHPACRRDTACMGGGAAISFALSASGTSAMADQSWAMKGELVLSCNCTVFCPCVLSLGNHPPTEGYCQTWAGFRVDSGHFGDVDLSGLNLGLVMEIPGYMSRGNWTAGLFIDKRASIYAVKALTRIFTGKAGGTTSLLSILVGKFLGVEQVPITYETRDKTRLFQIPKIIDGAVTPIPGKDRERDTVISNSEYWIAPEIIVAKVGQEPHARLWPQLELRRPFGRDLQAGLARTVKRRSRSPGRRHAHFRSICLPHPARSWPSCRWSRPARSAGRRCSGGWAWRCSSTASTGRSRASCEVKEILPTWSGELLDNIIDYVTYVLIPAFALYQRGLMGEGLSFLSAAIIVVSSAIYYADTGMKTKENFFKGFPVVWNMVVFTLFVIEPGEWVSFAVVVVAGILTFVPVNFLHPGPGGAAAANQSRRRCCGAPWCAGARPRLPSMPDRSAGRAKSFHQDRHRRDRPLSVCIGGIMQLFPNLGAKKAEPKKA